MPTLVLFAQSTGTSGQIPYLPKDIAPAPSPDASSLTKYVDAYIDHAFGVLQISVPLFSWQVGSMQMGLSLSYATGAVNVGERAGSVGIGWNLSGGGTITRTAIGFPDEMMGCEEEPDYNKQSPSLNKSIELAYLQDAARDYKDVALDRYSYTIPGYSGTFYISSKGDVRQFPETSVRINRLKDTSDYEYYFRIVTPEGVEYTFHDREESRVVVTPATLSAENKERDYTYVSAWHLTQAVSAERADTVRWDYQILEPLHVNTCRNDSTWSFYQTIQRDLRTEDPVHDYGYYGANHRNGTNSSMIYTGRRVPKRIHSRTATIEFSNKTVGTLRDDEDRTVITAMTVRNHAGEVVSTVALDYTSAVMAEPLLSKVSICRDGIEVDRREFIYNDGGLQTDAGDMFGNPNRSTPSDAHNVYLSYGELNEVCTSDTAAMKSWTLKSVLDLMGTRTDIEYSPVIIRTDTIVTQGGLPDLPGPGVLIPGPNVGPLFSRGHTVTRTEYRHLAPQLRVSKVTMTDAATSKKRIRTFTYEGDTTTVDLSRMNPDWFRTLTGTYSSTITKPAAVSIKENLSASLTSESRYPGVSVASTRVVHSKVTETVTGTDITTPLVTERYYDVTPAIHRPVRVVPYVTHRELNEEGDIPMERFLGMNSREFATGQTSAAWMFDQPSFGYYFREQIGGTPLLIRQRELRGSGATAVEISRTEYAWFSPQADSMTVATHVEPLVYRSLRNDVQEIDNLDDNDDFHHFPVVVFNRTWLCDSVRQTTFFEDGASRTVTTLQAWNGHASRWEKTQDAYPDQSLFFNLVGGSEDHTLLRKAVTIGPGARIEQHMAYAGNLLRSDSEYPRLSTRPSQPVAQAWICGNDTLLSRTEFKQFATGSNLLPLPSRMAFGHKGSAPADVIEISAYSPYGHPMAFSRNNGPTRHLKWGHDGDCLVSDSVAGIPGAVIYEHTPLVGCTTISAPYGKTTRYTYSAGRLVGIADTESNPLSAWEYAMMGCISEYDEPESVNSVTAITYGGPAGAGAMRTSTFYDSFGLPYLTRAYDAGGYNDGSDIITATRTDALGRTLAEWMPFRVSSGDLLTPDNINAKASEFQADTRPARTTVYDDSRLSSPVSVTEAGQGMEGHPAVSRRLCSRSSGELVCQKWTHITGGGALKSRDNWGDGDLDVTETTDADGCRLMTFTDFRGNKLLERRVLSPGQYADTYYVYDNIGRLRMVLPPKLRTENKNILIYSKTNKDVKRYAYIYDYDKRMLLTSKKLPGADEIRYGYDRSRAVVMWSDGLLRGQGRVAFEFHDAGGRPTISGTALRDSVTGLENSSAIAIPELTSHVTKPGFFKINFGDIHDINNKVNLFLVPSYSVELSDVKMHKVRFYDSYGFFNTGYYTAIDSAMTATASMNTAPTLLTGELTAVFSDSDCSLKTPAFIASAMRYDTEGRVVEHCATSLDGKLIHTLTDYAIDGQPTKMTTRISSDKESDEITHSYTYDNWRRETADYMTVGHSDGTVSYTDNYSPIERRYGNTGKLWYVQPADEKPYSIKYNLRGQIRGLESYWFQQEIFYENGGKTPRYNGDISAVTWRHYGMPVGDENRWRYDFTYDGLDRLTAADFSQTYTDNDASGRDYSCSYTYDINSNLTSITRMGPVRLWKPLKFDCVDRLTMTLDGNQTVEVRDQAQEILLEESLDFSASDGSGRATRTYDANGNLYSDTSRDIVAITYNPAGLPMRIDRGEGRQPVFMIYDADGNRLAYVIGEATAAEDGEAEETGAGLTRLYHGPLTYENGALQRVATPVGYIADRRFHAFYPDYQGNVRVVGAGGTDFRQSTHYYPYGLPFAEGYAPARQPHKYSGKELITDKSLNVYDFHARLNDPASGSFFSSDPKGEDRYGLTPYNFCSANPVSRVDPDGQTDYFVSGTETRKYVDDGQNVVYEVSAEQYEQLEAIGFSITNEGYQDIISNAILRNDLFPTVNDVLAKEAYQSWNGPGNNDNCYNAAIKQNNCKTEPRSDNENTDMYTTDGSVNFEKGKGYIKNELIKGNSVVAGVTTGVNRGNQNPLTGHFINIVGMGFTITPTGCQNYFRYYDNAREFSKFGRSESNRLSEQTINGEKVFYRFNPQGVAKVKEYYMTEYRKNVK